MGGLLGVGGKGYVGPSPKLLGGGGGGGCPSPLPPVALLFLRLCFNPVALRMAETLQSFGLSECSRVNLSSKDMLTSS